MTAIRWLETDTASNVDISSPYAAGVYTSDGDRVIMCQLFADQVAGSGDYVMYLTLRIGGAGSTYVILPKTTMTAAAAETAIAGQSGWVNVRNGDVVTAYIDGLAGDTVTPDLIVRWFEDAALRPTTADRTFAVDASNLAVLGATQGAITWGQQKIVANVAGEGALDIRNANATGIGQLNDGGETGMYNNGSTGYGQYNSGSAIGQYNAASGGASIGQLNDGVVDGQHNIGGTYGSLNTGGTDGMNCTGTINAGLQLSGGADGLISTGVAGYGEYITGGTAAINPEYMSSFFNVDSAETSATAIEGSVVKEIADAVLLIGTVFPAGAIDFTYTITDSVTTLPIEGVEVWISTDNPAVNIVWKGDTDAFGIARDVNGDLPALDAGTYYFWRQKAGYTFTDPDTEVVS